MERHSQRKLSSTMAVFPGRSGPTCRTALRARDVNWLNTTFIVLLITVTVAAVVGSLARQLLGSIFELDEETERADSDPPHARRADAQPASERRYV